MYLIITSKENWDPQGKYSYWLHCFDILKCFGVKFGYFISDKVNFLILLEELRSIFSRVLYVLKWHLSLGYLIMWAFGFSMFKILSHHEGVKHWGPYHIKWLTLKSCTCDPTFCELLDLFVLYLMYQLRPTYFRRKVFLIMIWKIQACPILT